MELEERIKKLEEVVYKKTLRKASAKEKKLNLRKM
jgi:hypothetical protein